MSAPESYSPEAPVMFDSFRELRTRAQRRRAAWSRAYNAYLHLPSPVRRVVAGAARKVGR